MSLDTQLNILAVILAAIAVIGVAVCAYFILKNGRALNVVRDEAHASKVAVNGLPKAIAPVQEPILAKVLEMLAEAERLTELLRENADREQLYKNLVRENTELRRQVGTLEHKIGVSEGKEVMLNDMVARQTGVINGQSGQINKLLVAISEQTAVNARQQALIEELTRALPNGKAHE